MSEKPQRSRDFANFGKQFIAGNLSKNSISFCLVIAQFPKLILENKVLECLLNSPNN